METIFVMSFNIRNPNPADGENYWSYRKEKIAGLIKYHSPDIIGLQEAYRSQLDDLMEFVPEYNWTGVCRTNGLKQPDPDNEFTAILFKKESFKILDEGTFWLSESPNVAGSIGWDAKYARNTTWVKMMDRRDESIFFHFNTHFDHKGKLARIESASLLLEEVDKIASGYPTIITGDLNSTETSEVYKTLTDKSQVGNFTDAISKSELPHYGPKITFLDEFHFNGNQGKKIDYIFFKNNIEILKHAVISDSWCGKLPSDHLPVISEIKIR